MTPQEQSAGDPVEGSSEGPSGLSRRDLLKKGWSVPVVVAMAVPSTAKAWGQHRSPGKKKDWDNKKDDWNEKKDKWEDWWDDKKDEWEEKKDDWEDNRGNNGNRGGRINWGDLFGGLFD